MNRTAIKDAKRIVIKIGSALLTNDGAGVDRDAVDDWVGQIAELISAGKEVVLVSSGAIAEGIARLGWAGRPDSIHDLQAAAAVGQMGLVQTYETSFLRFDRRTAQILLDHDDLASRQRYLNARGVLQTLMQLGVIPIVNENDTVVTDEIRFGDNDNLAAVVANLIDADILVILTDKDALDSLVGESTSGLGRGGMVTKLQAARMAASSGCSTMIAGGRNKNVLLDVCAGKHVGTLLTANEKPIAARKQWLAGQLQVKGSLELDVGAVKVLVKHGRSLLPVGIVGVSGRFGRGDLVSCLDDKGNEVARGLVNYSAEEAIKICGQSSDTIADILGYRDHDEMIHRDNLVLN